MVFLDASLPSDADVDRLLVDRGLIDPIKPTELYANGGETFRYSIHEEARTAMDAIPDVPISYLRATLFDAPPGAPKDEMQAIGQKGIDALLAHSSNGKQVDVDGPHFPLPEQPVNERCGAFWISSSRPSSVGVAKGPGWRASWSTPVYYRRHSTRHRRSHGPTAAQAPRCTR